MDSMRAVVVDRPGAAAVQRVPVPEPGPGEVLIRVGAAGICGSDVELLEGRRPAPYVRYPIIPGHEWAGMVAVVGAGTLGLLAVALLARVGPARLALVGTRRSRLALGHELGATETWNLRDGRRPAPGFDLVLEAAGTVEGARTAVALGQRGSTVVLEGISGEPGGVDADAVALGHLRVQGVFGASRSAWLWVTELFAAGLLDTASLVSHSFPLEEHAAAFATLADRSSGSLKVQLTPA